MAIFIVFYYNFDNKANLYSWITKIVLKFLQQYSLHAEEISFPL